MNEQLRPVHVAVKSAVGGTFPEPAVTVTLLVIEAVAPPSSVTVSFTV